MPAVNHVALVLERRFCRATHSGQNVSENHFDSLLEELKERSVDRLLKAEVFDVSAFEAFREHLWRKATGLQKEYAISKQILFSIRSATAAIKSRAEYIPSIREHLHWAHDFDLMLDRLIAGEIQEDRKSGVPRIM
jgi:hypothetical protein